MGIIINKYFFIYLKKKIIKYILIANIFNYFLN